MHNFFNLLANSLNIANYLTDIHAEIAQNLVFSIFFKFVTLMTSC